MDVALADGYLVSFYCVHIVLHRVCCFRTSYPEQKWRPMENGENTILTNFDLHSVQNWRSRENFDTVENRLRKNLFLVFL